MSTLSLHPCEFGQSLPAPLPASGKITPATHLAQVAELAYHLWKQSGFAVGAELDCWHEAEQRVPAAVPASSPRPAK